MRCLISLSSFIPNMPNRASVPGTEGGWACLGWGTQISYETPGLRAGKSGKCPSNTADRGGPRYARTKRPPAKGSPAHGPKVLRRFWRSPCAFFRPGGRNPFRPGDGMRLGMFRGVGHVCAKHAQPPQTCPTSCVRPRDGRRLGMFGRRSPE